MLRSLAGSFLVSFLALVPSRSAQTEDPARLVPADATVLVRIDSLDGLLDLIHSFGVLGAPAARMDKTMLLAGMSFLGDPGQVDGKRPLYLAVTVSPASQGPLITWVAPVANPALFKATLPNGMVKTATLGTYVGVSMLPKYVPGSVASPLVARLKPGVVAVHLDLATLLEMFRPMIDMGLQQAQAALDQPATDEMPLDVQPMMESYLSGFRTLLDSAETLDLGVQRRASELALFGDFTARAGSTLDGWANGPTADGRALAGYVDPASHGQVVFTGNLFEYMERFQGFIDGVLQMYPEPFRSDLDKMFAIHTRLSPLLEPGLIAGFDFGPEGMHGSYVLRSKKPDEVIAVIEDMLRQLDHEGGFLHVGAAETLAVDGLQAQAMTLTVDYDALVAMIASMAPKGQEADSAQAQEFRRSMETLYGRGMRLGLAAKDGLAAVAFGNDDAALRADFARLRTPAAPAKSLLALLGRIEPGAAGLAYHVDFGAMMGQMMNAMQGVLPTGTLPFPEQGLAFDIWGGIKGRTWSSGVAMDVQEMIAFLQKMQGLEGK